MIEDIKIIGEGISVENHRDECAVSFKKLKRLELVTKDRTFKMPASVLRGWLKRKIKTKIKKNNSNSA